KATPTPLAVVQSSPTPMVLAAIPMATPTPAETPAPTPVATPKPVIISSAAPTPKAVASWQTYRPGQMPRGRLIDVPDLDALSKNGGPKSTMYLQGDFTVK